jgi:ATP-dependent DNA helicase RecG
LGQPLYHKNKIVIKNIGKFMIVKNEDQIIKIIDACKRQNSEMIEGEEIEFKEFGSLNALHNSKELAEELSALSNKSGGVVIIGIKDGSNVLESNWITQLVGFQKADTVEIEQRIKGKLKPSIDLTAKYYDFEGKSYLAIHTPVRRDSLVSTSSGKVCIRDGRSSRPMSPEEIQSAVSRLHNYDWSADIIMGLDHSCFDEISLEEAYHEYCTKKKYTEENKPNHQAFLEAIGATSNGSILKSGVLFLGKETIIRKWLGVFEYRFSWKTRSGKLLINDVWDSNLWLSIKRAKKHFTVCNTEHEFTFKSQNYKCKTLDEVAFHEGFMNSLVHRDYTKEGMVVVDFDTNKMCITNPGNFYGGVSAENIGTHQPRHRNKTLAKLMMNFQLVDRAGMGVRRMGLGSLMYGRQFPVFREVFDTVEVTMPAESILPGIFALTQLNPDKYGIIDLIILNSLYRNGSASVIEISKRAKGLVDDTWTSIKESADRNEQFELCATKECVFVRVTSSWNIFLDVKKTLRISLTSEKHVKVYDYLMEFGEATNEDITNLLGHKNATHTSAFLREATYAKRTGSGTKARWSLIEKMV